MKTGYLAKEQFKDWKADEVKALAKELGASCDGKKEAEEASAKAEGTVQVKCIERFEDLQAQQIREAGEVWDVTPGRADTLEKKRLVEKV